MKVVLINPPSGRFDRTYLAPPLGLLTLAAVVRQQGHQVSVLDLNLEVLSDPSLGNKQFYDTAVKMIAQSKPDVVGFTSMCLESHVSLELARQIKFTLSNVIIILGGTHFGAIAREVLENFPFVDFVISGEGEHALPAILNNCLKESLSLPTNVSHRREGEILTGLTEAIVPLLEDLPFPAYDLVDLERYFSLNPFRLLNYEAGRGCVFKCSFCYSPFQYGDAVRNKKPEEVVKDLWKLSDLGARHIFFVQDNLLNSPRWATELCTKLAAANLPLTWECYATYPQLKESLIDLLAEAGCKGIFTGIDAVSSGSQKRMNKPFLRNWETTSHKLSYCLKRGIQPICAFILEEPGQDQEKTEAAIYTALECIRLGGESHLNTLSLYNGTALSQATAVTYLIYSSIKAELLMDTPEVVQSNDFAKRFPELFPYHSTYCDVSVWEVFVAKVHTLSSLMIGLTRTLSQYVIEEENSIWKCLNYINSDFVAWLRQQEPHYRREASILKFTQHFAAQNISEKTRSLLEAEVASVLLSKNHASRSVNFIVNAQEKRYRLAWFIDLQKPYFFDDKLFWLSKEPFQSNSSNTSPSKPFESSKIALLSERKMIKVFVASPELRELILRIEAASASNRSAPLSARELELLEQDGWIWPEASDLRS